MTFVQFFGPSLAVNPHPHLMFLDGVFARAKNSINLFEQTVRSQESMFDVLEMIYLRLEKLFAKTGYAEASGEASVPDDFDRDAPMPFRSRDPKAYRRKGSLLANPLFQHPDPDMMCVQS